jgi:hypothetical protein
MNHQRFADDDDQIDDDDDDFGFRLELDIDSSGMTSRVLTSKRFIRLSRAETNSSNVMYVAWQ